MADEQAPSEKQLLLDKLYVKNLSFASPKVPEIFTSDINTQIDLNVRSVSREIDAEHVEVTLTLTVKSIAQEDTVFLIELVQAGIFAMKGYTPEERFALCGGYCPGMLYPYARETIAGIVNNGGFPPLLLRPLDFDALYAQNMHERAKQALQAQPAQTPTVPASGDGETL